MKKCVTKLENAFTVQINLEKAEKIQKEYQKVEKFFSNCHLRGNKFQVRERSQ